jgi:hypothetical protein
MAKDLKPIDKFNFLIGTWKLEYRVPKSQFSDADSGEGEFKCILNNQYVSFDYFVELSKSEGKAHSIFV